jgi:hypothetical protein
MRVVLVVFFALFSVAAQVANADPVAWVDRCFEKAWSMGQPSSTFSSVRAEQECIEIIVSYCAFDDNAGDCFSSLSQEFEARATKTIERLPQIIETDDGLDVADKMNAQQQDFLARIEEVFKCQQKEEKDQCKAMRALSKFTLARLNAESITKIEDPK